MVDLCVRNLPIEAVSPHAKLVGLELVKELTQERHVQQVGTLLVKLPQRLEDRICYDLLVLPLLLHEEDLQLLWVLLASVDLRCDLAGTLQDQFLRQLLNNSEARCLERLLFLLGCDGACISWSGVSLACLQVLLILPQRCLVLLPGFASTILLLPQCFLLLLSHLFATYQHCWYALTIVALVLVRRLSLLEHRCGINKALRLFWLLWLLWRFAALARTLDPLPNGRVALEESLQPGHDLSLHAFQASCRQVLELLRKTLVLSHLGVDSIYRDRFQLIVPYSPGRVRGNVRNDDLHGLGRLR
mmetsp:Transcript_38795/g.112061  ORF Transcript_38795/g.112061 Transcript_38795/m.112061 type:complete len:302 (+) Transcript_38795:503-1408(+)